MKMLKNVLFVMFFMFIVYLGVFFISNKIDSLYSSKSVSVVKINNKKQIINKLTEYIIDNSMYIGKYKIGIPDDVARDIVVNCFETKHPLLYLAMIQKESSFNPYSISNKNAVGLCQIHLKSNLNILLKNNIIRKPSDLFIIKYNIKAMDYLFSQFLRRTKGNIKKALFLYLGTKNEAYVNGIYDNLGKITMVIESDIKQQKCQSIK